MIKKLARYIGEFKRSTIISPFLIVGEVALEILIPYLMASIIDDGVEKSDINHIVLTGILMILMALFSLLFGAAAALTSSKAAAGFAKNLRFAIFPAHCYTRN